jgi:hypothetical protein
MEEFDTVCGRMNEIMFRSGFSERESCEDETILQLSLVDEICG